MISTRSCMILIIPVRMIKIRRPFNKHQYFPGELPAVLWSKNQQMETLHQSITSVPVYVKTKPSLVHRFSAWCRAQQKNRLAWLAVSLFSHGCLITPLTLLFVMLAGNHMLLWSMTIGAMTMTLVVNLAALPTRVTIPVFFFGLLIDLAVIVNCIAIGFGSITG